MAKKEDYSRVKPREYYEKRAFNRQSIEYEKKRAAGLAKKNFLRAQYEGQYAGGGKVGSFTAGLGYGLHRFAQSSTRFRAKQMEYARGIQRPINVPGTHRRIKAGPGRPRGPSGRYYIPGQGAVGVYEYRMWLRAQLREKRANFIRNQSLSPEQIRALAQIQAQQQARYQDPEQKTIPDTTGKSNIGRYHQEADEAANIIP